MLKVVGKSPKNGSDMGRIFFNIFAKLIFALLLSGSLHTQIICTKMFIKLLLQDKKWQRWQNCNFAISCKFLSRLGKSTHMAKIIFPYSFSDFCTMVYIFTLLISPFQIGELLGICLLGAAFLILSSLGDTSFCELYPGHHPSSC